MFRMKRMRWTSLVLLLGVLLAPLPATAGSLREGPAAASWEGLWSDLLAWLGLGPSFVEMTSPYIDPLGQSSATSDLSAMVDPLGTAANSSPYIDPNGQGSASETSPMVDPNGQP